MRDDDERPARGTAAAGAAEALREVLGEPRDPLDVEVVGRLVERDDVVVAR